MNAVIGRISTILGVVASTLVMLVMLVMVADVATRMVSGGSLPGVYEFVELGVAAAVFLGLPVAQRRDGMIRVDIVASRLPVRAREAVDVFAAAFSLLVCAVLTAGAVQNFQVAVASGEARTGLLVVPTWPSKLAIAVGLFVLCIELLITLVGLLRHRAQADAKQSHPTI